MLSASEVSFSRWSAIQIYLPLPLSLQCYAADDDTDDDNDDDNHQLDAFMGRTPGASWCRSPGCPRAE